MLFAIGCAILLLVDSSRRRGKTFFDESGAEKSTTFYAFLSLGLAFLVPIGFTYKHFVIRKYLDSYNYYYLAIDCAILESITCSLFLILYMRENQLEMDQILMGSLSGWLMVLGRIFIAVGIAEGVAGPAQAIMSTNGIWVTLLTHFLDGQVITQLQILAIASGVLGAFIIGMGDFLYQNSRKSQRKSEEIPCAKQNPTITKEQRRILYEL
uniref:EamA domain-containing protein n=1 Tax=Strombidium rassoulzadegani TaxID=1082188 RepID=A0A7S3CMZ1_9SPIT|mmetsp:Transcript_17589/g.29695  ORF Transcript_17589/g.29695 Transcript_17589/m.29695 type:complete len:211 (+) Transcript_17589:683-1315(+)